MRLAPSLEEVRRAMEQAVDLGYSNLRPALRWGLPKTRCLRCWLDGWLCHGHGHRRGCSGRGCYPGGAVPICGPGQCVCSWLSGGLSGAGARWVLHRRKPGVESFF